MPMAPACICILPMAGILWVLMCGRLPMPCRARCACTRRMLSSMMAMSMVTAGVSRSRTALMTVSPHAAGAAHTWAWPPYWSSGERTTGSRRSGFGIGLGHRHGDAAARRRHGEAVTLLGVLIGGPARGRVGDPREKWSARDAAHRAPFCQILDRVGERAERRLVLSRRARNGLRVRPHLGRPGRGQVLADRFLLALTPDQRHHENRGQDHGCSEHGGHYKHLPLTLPSPPPGARGSSNPLP